MTTSIPAARRSSALRPTDRARPTRPAARPRVPECPTRTGGCFGRQRGDDAARRPGARPREVREAAEAEAYERYAESLRNDPDEIPDPRRATRTPESPRDCLLVTELLRGRAIWFELGQNLGRKPGVIVTNNPSNRALKTYLSQGSQPRARRAFRIAYNWRRRPSSPAGCSAVTWSRYTTTRFSMTRAP